MGPLQLENRGRAQIDHHVYFLPGMLPTRIRVGPCAELHIGAQSGFNSGAVLYADRRLTIGERCIFASMVTLSDVTIERDVWVAARSDIEPGVTIEKAASSRRARRSPATFPRITSRSARRRGT